MPQRSSRRPNVLVFFTDQQRHDSTGVHGNPLELTPNFDQMATSGTHLFHSFTCQPVCGPARSCLQTGQYATTTGCFKNNIPLASSARTLAHHFGEAGYRTGYIGKWHLASHEPVPREERGGYDFWLAANGLEHTSDAYRAELFDGDNRLVRLPGYRVDALTDAAIRWIDRQKDDPFFLFLSFLEPHHQNHRDDYPAPAILSGRYTSAWTPPDLAALGGSSAGHLAGYWGMVKRLDEALGRLRDALQSLDIERDTIILFTSDHACHFKTRNDEYKRSCHDASIRVPTAFCGPGFEGGGQKRELVSLVDLPPTLLDAAGIPVPQEMQGRSLLPLLRGDKAGWPDDVFVQISESQTGRAVRTRRWKYSVTAPADFRSGSAASYREDCLYDLLADPYELRNLIFHTSHREVVGVMRERLLRRMEEAGEARAPIELVAPTVPIGQWEVTSEEAHS